MTVFEPMPVGPMNLPPKIEPDWEAVLREKLKNPPPPRDPREVITPHFNIAPVNCHRCGWGMAEHTAHWVHFPARLSRWACDVCLLYTEFEEDGAALDNMQKFPREDVSGAGVAMISPYDYQRIDAVKVNRMRSILINHEMGCGKTVITALGGLRSDCPNYVVCPLNAVEVWHKEVLRWRPEIEVVVTPETKNSDRWTHVPKAGQLMILPYSRMPDLRCLECRAYGVWPCPHPTEQPADRFVPGPTVLVADEVHYLQNPSTGRRRLWNTFRDVVWRRGGFLRGLTGTEISNDAEDLWEILAALKLEGAAFEHGRKEFREIFKDFLGKEKGKRKPPTEALLLRCQRNLRAVRISRLIEHVLPDLPKPEDHVIKFTLDRAAVDEVDEAVCRMIAVRKALQDVRDGHLDNPNGKRPVYEPENDRVVHKSLEPAEKERRKALFDAQVEHYFQHRPWDESEELRLLAEDLIENKTSAVEMTELSRVRALLARCKIHMLRRLVQEHAPGGRARYRVDLPEGMVDATGRPLVVFSQHVGILEDAFADDPGWTMIHGGVPQKERPRRVERFQRGDVQRGIALSIVANAEAINLTRSARVIFVDRHWNPAKNDQALRRVVRPGQTADRVIVYTLMSDHKVDALVARTEREKKRLAKALKDHEQSMEGLVRA